MTLKEQINQDFINAYKSRDMVKKTFLGVLKGSIETQEGKQIESTDENIIKVVKSLEKGLNETIENKNRMGLDTFDEKNELSYLAPYLPELMSETDIRLIVKEMLSRPNINKNIGFLMGTFNKEIRTMAFDNKVVSKIIQEEIAA